MIEYHTGSIAALISASRLYRNFSGFDIKIDVNNNIQSEIHQTDGTDWKDFDDRALATHDAPYKVTSNATFQITKTPLGKALLQYKIMPSRHLWDDHLDGPISDEEDENMHTDEDVEEEEEEEEVRINIKEDVEDQVEDDNDVDEGIEL
ncbi:hypothetical protein HCN44_009919 [Aphidius gifuensis]|uniref:Uncharacterized protein n=1 Tax=Aphidius gifuensis TaxID=684658 RepID=A0A834Y1M1_APHGI|nr:hypothetical protein HCN44_009919 [Aphidius gifuensis]